MTERRDVARDIINKVREFKTHSVSKEQLLRDIMKNPKKIDNQEVLSQVEESAKIVKELFSLVDELDIIEGNAPYLED